ncbi:MULTISPECIES: hypothetical protein [unclassified Streptomyces]|uniref:hypothetical protein n=1 Tax=unclassified Streptomyces TaxID=2593676 RepID=UPI00278C415C|nr:MULTISPECIES: hypothetical protein [unclassified Streptomyces]
MLPAVLRGPRPWATGAFLLSYCGLAVVMPLGSVPAFAALATVSYVADARLSAKNTRLFRSLRNNRLGVTLRFALRQMLLLGVLYQAGMSIVAAVYVFTLFYVLQVPQSFLLGRIRRARKLPLETRNIDLAALHIPDTPSSLVMRRAFEKTLHLDVFAVAGLLVSAQTGAAWCALVGCVLTPTLLVVHNATVVNAWLRARRTPSDETMIEHIDTWLKDYRPTVALYFSGMKSSEYQVNMWLDTLAGLGERPLLLLRDRHIHAALAPTPIPVLCVPNANLVMNLDFSTVRVVFYAANVGPNIHMLRMPTATHVFIGHGDSDKQASVNPYAKVYDEVWTAGRAGRDRWALANVGVRDESIVEVGRPQLATIEPSLGLRPADRPLTVLYAPTWESWEPGAGITSVTDSGELIVQRLLDSPLDIRILYKPHPYTGARDPEAKEASWRITELLKQANASAHTEVDETGIAPLQQEVSTVNAEVRDPVGRRRSSADAAERSRDAFLDDDDAAAMSLLASRRDRLYWESRPDRQHVVIEPDGPHLYSCFNQCDLLISDISSVVSDFVASGKPYAIVDGAELGEDLFRKEYTAAVGAYVLSPSAEELDDVLRIVVGDAPDHLAQDRLELKKYLLGPDEPGPMDRFIREVRRLAGSHEPPATQIPAPLESSAQGLGSEKHSPKPR